MSELLLRGVHQYTEGHTPSQFKVNVPEVRPKLLPPMKHMSGYGLVLLKGSLESLKCSLGEMALQLISMRLLYWSQVNNF